MHTHEHSDRCIIVLEGRGFFHVSGERIETFTGADVQTIAVRERDVLMFTRRVVHTFSTFDEPMVLLSCHLPHIELEDQRQYTLPATRWIAGEHLECTRLHAVTLSGWSLLTGKNNSPCR